MKKEHKKAYLSLFVFCTSLCISITALNGKESHNAQRFLDEESVCFKEHLMPQIDFLATEPFKKLIMGEPIALVDKIMNISALTSVYNYSECLKKQPVFSQIILLTKNSPQAEKLLFYEDIEKECGPLNSFSDIQEEIEIKRKKLKKCLIHNKLFKHYLDQATEKTSDKK